MKIFPTKENALNVIFSKEKPIIGMIHLKPLPGSPHYKGESLDEVISYALKEVEAYNEGGIDGLIVENGWDLPFSKPDDIGLETAASVAYVAKPIIEKANVPVGINILANAAKASLAVARATDSPFIRVNQWVNAYVANEGIVEGAAAKALRYRSNIKGDKIKIFADVHVKHGSHSIVADRNIEEQTKDAIFFDADVLIATGNRTGDPTEISELELIKNNTELPVIIGSGLNEENVNKIMKTADGAIVGTSLKKDGCWWKPVQAEKVKSLIDEVNKLR